MAWCKHERLHRQSSANMGRRLKVERVLGFLTILLTACRENDGAIVSITSFCHQGKVPSRAAIERVLYALDDGTDYRSPAGPFRGRPQEELANWGGVVVQVRANKLPLPRTISEASKYGGYSIAAAAIPDVRFTLNSRHRLLFLKLVDRRSGDDGIWPRHSSADGEDVCV
jgi:hypothetical protein